MDKTHIITIILTTSIFLIIFRKTTATTFIGTFVHEFGHVFGTWLIAERVQSIHLNLSKLGTNKHNAYGFVTSTTRNRFSIGFIAFFGYIFPPICVLLFTILLIDGLGEVALLTLYVMILYFIIKANRFYQAFIVTSIIIGVIYLFYMFSIDYNYILIIIIVMLGYSSSKSLVEIIKLRNSHVSWDGYVIKQSLFVPVHVTVVIWIGIIISCLISTCYMIYLYV